LKPGLLPLLLKWDENVHLPGALNGKFKSNEIKFISSDNGP